ncbi:MAG: NFACT RNA binding domain-containing protein [Minisyncoccales bacterium]
MKPIKFREFILESGTRVLAGKDAESNEALIEQVQPEEVVLHTKERGSPFVNIKGSSSRIKEFFSDDLKKAAIICARYSHDWRDNKSDVIVHKFKGKDIYKEKKMPLGTFGVRKKKNIKIKKKDIEKFIEEQKK